MTERIKHSYWLDSAFEKTKVDFDRLNETWVEFNRRATEAREQDNANYLTYLNGLNDEDFLSVYEDIRRNESQLD